VLEVPEGEKRTVKAKSKQKACNRNAAIPRAAQPGALLFPERPMEMDSPDSRRTATYSDGGKVRKSSRTRKSIQPSGLNP
jgi:hypothetical protein